MKVVHLFKIYLPDAHGGIQECIRQLCLQTSRLGVENTVIAPSKNVSSCQEEQREECRLIRFPETVSLASTSLSFSLIGRYRDLVKDADLIHYHFPWPFADFLHISCRIKKPYIITYQSDIVKQVFLKKLYSPLMRWFLSGAEAITVSSPKYLESSTDLAPYRNKCKVMLMGLDETSYPIGSTSSLKKWQERLGRDFFLFIGVLRYYKGLQYLIKAVKGSRHKLVIGGSGPMESELKAMVNELGVESQVEFTGFLSEEDKVALFKLCKGFVFPSHLRSEAYGISLLEAAMFGKPLISCEIGTGTSYINQHEQTGFVVPPENPDSLRWAMDVLSDDLELARKMGTAARKRFLEKFTAKQMGETCFEIYKKVLSP